MKSIGDLQSDLDEARATLKGVDDNIKRLIGRDPNEIPNRRRNLGPQQEHEPELRAKRVRDESNQRVVFISPPKSRRVDSGDEDELPNKPTVLSRVIATPKEEKSRQEVLAEQNADKKGRERNRRMFGALLGTLQKFRQEESKQKEKEEKRARIEKKLEDAAKKEKEDLRKEKQDLFMERKRRQEEIRRIEIKMLRLKEQEEWESKHLHLLNFIRTKAEPHIFYLPKIHNETTQQRLGASRKAVAAMIEKKRKNVQDELEGFEMRRRKRAEDMSTERKVHIQKKKMKEKDAAVQEGNVFEGFEEEESEEMAAAVEMEQPSISKDSGKDEEEHLDVKSPEVSLEEEKAEGVDEKVEVEEEIEASEETAPSGQDINMTVDEKEFQPLYD